MSTPGTGAVSRLAFHASNVVSSGSQLEFVSCGINKSDTLVIGDGIRGTRQRHASKTRTGAYKVSGPVSFYASPLLLDKMLPLILGANESTDVFSPSDTTQSGQFMADMGNITYWWSLCHCAKATLQMSAGQPVMLNMDIEGSQQTAGATFPSTSAPTDSFYVMTDAVFTFNSDSYEFSDLSISIDNLLDTERFNNALYRSYFPSSGQVVTLTATLPWTDSEEALRTVSYGGASGSVTLTNGDVAGTTCTIDFANLQVTNTSATVTARGETRLSLSMEAFRSGSNPTIKFTNTHTLD